MLDDSTLSTLCEYVFVCEDCRSPILLLHCFWSIFQLSAPGSNLQSFITISFSGPFQLLQWMPPPLPRQGFTLIYSKTFLHLYLQLSEVIRISLRHNLAQVWWDSIAMVTRFNVTSSMWSIQNACFSPSYLKKSTKCWQKAEKCLILWYSTLPASNILISALFFISSNFG